MNETVGAVGGGLMFLLILLAIVLTALWIILPFAVFAINEKMKTLISEQKTTNQLLNQLRALSQSSLQVNRD
jgi:biopolymer transport protein ExbB/TolQ